jgi:signal transduction histidine kinase
MRGTGAALEAIRDAAGTHPRAVDAVGAGVLAALITGEVLFSDVAGPMLLLVPLGLLTTLPLALRRELPLAVAILVTVGQLGLDQVSRVQEPQTTLLPFLVATYSVGAFAPRPAAATGLAVALAGLFLVEPGDIIVLWPLTAATWLVGRLVRSWHGQAVELGRLAAELERERAETARHAVADERARIARDLHDVVGHNLSLLVLQAGAERLALPADRPQTRDALAAIEQSGRASLSELRRLVGVLREDDDGPALAPLPGVARLDELAEQVRGAGLPVDLCIEGEPVPLPAGLDVSVYRIAQEALTNAVRHAADASAVTVRVRYGDGDLRLEVIDDGRSARDTDSNGHPGHGLIGMQERVSLYGGELKAGPRPGGGFAVSARLPVGSGG